MKTLDDYKKTDFGYELDDDEASLLKAIDEGHFTRVNNPEERNREIQAAAHKSRIREPKPRKRRSLIPPFANIQPDEQDADFAQQEDEDQPDIFARYR